MEIKLGIYELLDKQEELRICCAKCGTTISAYENIAAVKIKGNDYIHFHLDCLEVVLTEVIS